MHLRLAVPLGFICPPVLTLLDEKKHTTGKQLKPRNPACFVFQLLKKLWLIFYPKHIDSSAVDVVTVWRLPYSRRYPRFLFIVCCHWWVDEMNSVMAEMMNITAQEAVLRKQCQGFLSIVTAMQVKDCSMNTHIIQLNWKLTSQL
ncbi:hypothetical protein F2Q69_00021272 [Brassica cretica]|uniref:Uncharacterized protein n=1 Tax=Brassica cretica TaxID=69181 RepID=A0A8S9QCM8_BRACR|nr:hypothetical protein F2Q69_00021272 [Brassica cretica]